MTMKRTIQQQMKDERLAHFYARMEAMADMLVYWLDQNHAYTAGSIYFMAGVLTGLIEESWPDVHTRPAIYTNLLTAIDRMGEELGPVVAQIELDGLPSRVRNARRTESQKKQKATVN